jgi:hypothetical protein
MKSQLRNVTDGDIRYTALMFVCPGCEKLGGSGLHMLPVNSPQTSPSWGWNENLEKPTLTPSILTKYDDRVCHSFLTDGVFEFLSDCSHELAGQKVEIPDLYEWCTNEWNDEA